MTNKRSHWGRRVAASAAAVALLATGTWAGWVVGSRTSSTEVQGATPVDVVVTEQSFGRNFTFNAEVTQERVPAAVNQLSGVVTFVSDAQQFSQGDIVYSVSDIPVRAVAGDKPFFRPMTLGDEGQDVRQLGQLLVDLGYSWEVQDTFSYWTQQAVLQWQRDEGRAPTGTVEMGELVAVPTLPQTLFVDRQGAVPGGVLAGGESIIQVPGGSPTFKLHVTPAQAAVIPLDTTVLLKFKDYRWPAVIIGSEEDQEMGEVLLALEAPDGGPPCAAECSALPASETLYVGADVQIVAPMAGPAVPMAAVTVQRDGAATVEVVGADGTLETTPVTVLMAQDGLVIVDGLTVGQVVRVFQADGAQPLPAAPTAPGGGGGGEGGGQGGDQSGAGDDAGSDQSQSQSQ